MTVIYSKGFGELVAHFAWIAAVEAAAVAAHRAGDAAAARRWTEVAATWPETDLYRTHNGDEDQDAYFNQLIAPALAGDFSALASWVDEAPVAQLAENI